MSSLFNLMPEAEMVCTLDPEELGLRMLPMLAEQERNRHGDALSLQILLDFSVGQYPERIADVKTAMREAWAWLEGAALLVQHPNYPGHVTHMRALSRRARQLAREGNPHRAYSARRIPRESLHPSIREDVWALYHRGDYDIAVFTAMKAVEVTVRDAAGLSAGDLGVRLMGKAFNSEDGPLTDMDVEKGERDARCALFVGAIGSYKNPQSHRHVDLDDPDEAAEIIMLANHLLRIVETRRAANKAARA